MSIEIVLLIKDSNFRSLLKDNIKIFGELL
jgi:hypothetical protein